FQAYGMPIPRCDRYDIMPVAHVAFPLLIPSCSDHRTVCLNPNRMAPTRCDRYHTSPVAHLTLAVFVPAGGENGTIPFKPTVCLCPVFVSIWTLPAATATMSHQSPISLLQYLEPPSAPTVLSLLCTTIW